MEANELLNRYAAGGRDFAGSNLNQAILSQTELYGVNLRQAKLSQAILSEANLGEANLSRADLRRASLCLAYLHAADLTEANLSGADLSLASLGRANLCGANLCEANLRGANLYGADLRGANCYNADFGGADLTGANLRGAYLAEANFNKADLSMAEGLLNAEQWLRSNFKLSKDGLIVYKAFGGTSFYQPWKIEEGAVIGEIVNPNPAEDCGCGVNFGTLEFVKLNFRHSQIRECILPPYVQVVVPYNTNGKARCAKLIVGKVVK